MYFQACLDSSPLRSSVQTLPISLVIAPFAFVAGTLVQVVQKYRWANVLAWCLALIGFGLLSTLDPTSSTGKWVGFQVILAAAIGLLVRLFPFVALCYIASDRHAYMGFQNSTPRRSSRRLRHSPSRAPRLRSPSSPSPARSPRHGASLSAPLSSRTASPARSPPSLQPSSHRARRSRTRQSL